MLIMARIVYNCLTVMDYLEALLRYRKRLTSVYSFQKGGKF